MSRNDPYLPDFATVSNGGTTTFDGSESNTGQAIINEIAGNFDANLFVEESNDGGTTFQVVAQLTTDTGNQIFSSDFHTQFNRIYVSQGERRLRVDDAGTGGRISVTGDER
jgi:hypothetical protein